MAGRGRRVNRTQNSGRPRLTPALFAKARMGVGHALMNTEGVCRRICKLLQADVPSSVLPVVIEPWGVGASGRHRHDSSFVTRYDEVCARGSVVAATCACCIPVAATCALPVAAICALPTAAQNGQARSHILCAKTAARKITNRIMQTKMLEMAYDRVYLALDFMATFCYDTAS